jgi:hypothetical protein
VWSGVYAVEQVTRGRVAFGTHCQNCHGADLQGGEGPTLVDTLFMRDWSGLTVRDLFDYVKAAMPEEAPSSVSDAEKLDILAFVFEKNGFPAGRDPLTADSDSLGRLLIEGKEGPTPPPVGAVVRTVGCVARESQKVWVLRQATAPVRTTLTAPAPDPSTPASGSHTLRLTGSDGLNAYEGQRVAVVGLMLRSAAGEGVNILNVTTVGPGCQDGGA